MSDIEASLPITLAQGIRYLKQRYGLGVGVVAEIEKLFVAYTILMQRSDLEKNSRRPIQLPTIFQIEKINRSNSPFTRRGNADLRMRAPYSFYSSLIRNQRKAMPLGNPTSLSSSEQKSPFRRLESGQIQFGRQRFYFVREPLRVAVPTSIEAKFAGFLLSEDVAEMSRLRNGVEFISLRSLRAGLNDLDLMKRILGNDWTMIRGCLDKD